MPKDKYKTWFIILGLAIAVLAVFWRVHNFEFVNYDDDKYVSENGHILSGLTVESITWVFTSEHYGNWHPLTGLSHILDCQFFGLDAGRHHLVNLLFHILNTLLLFIILRRMTGAIWQSAVVAAFFALHPLHVESVAWISERKDVLSTVCWLLAMAAYFHYVKNPKVSRYILTCILFAVGLMAKPMLVTLPFIFLLLDYWPLNRVKINRTGTIDWHACRHLVWEKIPFFVLSAISSVITFFVQKSAGAVAGIRAVSLTGRIANAVMSYIRYIEKLFAPVDLAVFYPYPEKLPAFWQIFAAAALLAIITIAVIRLGARHKYLPVGWFWYLGTLVPVIGLVQVGDQAMADRYTYVPLTGLFIIIAWGANDLLTKWRYKKTVLGILSSAVVLILAVLTWFQVGYWRDSMSLCNHAIKVTSGNYLAYNNRGIAYYDKGEYDLALSDYNKAIEANPGYVEAYNNRGNVYYNNGAYDRAIQDYDKAVKIDPMCADVYYNRGTAYKSKGEYNLAVSDYSKVIGINPGYSLAYFNKAGACELAGRKREAIEAYNAFIRFASGQSQYEPYIEAARKKIMELEKNGHQ